MTRRHKITALMLLALAAAGAAAGIVSSAGAHTPATFEFTNEKSENTAIVSRQHGTGTQAEHLIYIPGVGTITCLGPEFKGTAGKILNTTLDISTVQYQFCKLTSNNESVSFGQESCVLTFTASGEMVISSALGQDCKKKPMLFVTASGCVVSIPEQTVAGLGYTNVTGGGGVQEVTMSMTLTETKGKRNAKCGSEGEFTAGEYKAGNTFLGGVEDPGSKPIGMQWLSTEP